MIADGSQLEASVATIVGTGTCILMRILRSEARNHNASTIRRCLHFDGKEGVVGSSPTEGFP